MYRVCHFFPLCMFDDRGVYVMYDKGYDYIYTHCTRMILSFLLCTNLDDVSNISFKNEIRLGCSTDLYKTIHFCGY